MFKMSTFSRFSFAAIKFGTKSLVSLKSCRGVATLRTLNISSDRKIAYRKYEGTKQPTIIFVPGFMSNMEGSNAQVIERYCREQDYSFVRFDLEGLGLSQGDKRVVEMNHWIQDCQFVLDQLTSGPVLLVGYSLGSWISLITAINNPKKIHSLVLISPSVNFVWSYFLVAYNQATPEGKARLDAGKVYKFTSDYLEMFMRKDFAEGSRKHEIDLTKEIPIKVPVRILQGMKDLTVPYTMCIKIAEQLASDDVDIVMRKQEVRGFSDPEDLELLFMVLTQLLKSHPIPRYRKQDLSYEILKASR
ncbi:hypothetical protein B566_EDAN000654 [Ephemera danica]|nr:hypothetical protein B566_EDAN000654 [Ephemera danica]